MCQEGGSQESGEKCSEKDYCESKYVFVSSSEGESGEGWESESETIDDSSLYIPTPDHPMGINFFIFLIIRLMHDGNGTDNSN